MAVTPNNLATMKWPEFMDETMTPSTTRIQAYKENVSHKWDGSPTFYAKKSATAKGH